MNLKVIVHREDGGYWAEVPALPGCASQGQTMDELMRNIHEAVEGWLLVANDPRTDGEAQVIEIAV